MSDMIKDEFGGWMFTEDDRTALADILKAKFDSKQIDNFIVLLQWICFPGIYFTIRKGWAIIDLLQENKG